MPKLEIRKLVNEQEIMSFYPILLQLFDKLEKSKMINAVSKLKEKDIYFIGLYLENEPAGFAQFSLETNLENFLQLCG